MRTLQSRLNGISFKKNSLKEEEYNITHKLYVDNILGEYRDNMSDQLKKLKELREEHRITSDTHTKLKN